MPITLLALNLQRQMLQICMKFSWNPFSMSKASKASSSNRIPQERLLYFCVIVIRQKVSRAEWWKMNIGQRRVSDGLPRVRPYGGGPSTSPSILIATQKRRSILQPKRLFDQRPRKTTKNSTFLRASRDKRLQYRPRDSYITYRLLL